MSLNTIFFALISILPLMLYTVGATNITVTPLDSIVIGYPTEDLHVGDTVYLWVEDQVTDNYFDFYRETSMHVVYPNGTLQPPASIVNDICGGKPPMLSTNTFALSMSDKDGLKYGTSLLLDATGVYIAYWNITYGTLADYSVANASYCDLSSLSNQTFILNATMTAVPREPSSPANVTVTQRSVVTSTFASEPTGHYVEVNGAMSGQPVVNVWAFVVLLVVASMLG